MTMHGDLLKELFAVYDSLLEPSWTEHEAKMKKLWAAIDALKVRAQSSEVAWAVVRIQWMDSNGLQIRNEGLSIPDNGLMFDVADSPPDGAHSMRIGISQRKKEH